MYYRVDKKLQTFEHLIIFVNKCSNGTMLTWLAKWVAVITIYILPKDEFVWLYAKWILRIQENLLFTVKIIECGNWMLGLSNV